MGGRGKKKKKRERGTPWAEPEAIPSFLDPEFDSLEEAEADVRDLYRGMSGRDED